METSTILNFINQTIKKTKRKDLNWHTLKNNSYVKPLPFQENFDLPVLPNLHSEENLVTSDSYIANYKTGELTLLVFASPESILRSIPPYDCILSLRMQDDKSKYAIEICNSKLSSDISTQLIRLYNLIDKESSSLNALINDFLNS